MRRPTWVALLLLLCTYGGQRATVAESLRPAESEAKGRVVFCVMGDVPYSSADDELLPRQIADLPEDAEFLVHVGDIKRGSEPCDEAVYTKVAGMLGKSRVPTFVIPGDNEWNDCGSPPEAWGFWERHFLRFDQRWHHRFAVFRSLNREENFSFVRSGVLFLGLNLVGGRLHDADEWQRRHAENLEWTRRNFAKFGDAVHAVVIFGHAQPRADHDDYFRPMVEESAKLAKPILYLHGDGHRWMKDRPFSSENILRVQVDQGGIAPPLRVVVGTDSQQPFQFDRRR